MGKSSSLISFWYQHDPSCFILYLLIYQWGVKSKKQNNWWIFWQSSSRQICETLTCVPVSCRWPATTHKNRRVLRLQLQGGYAQVEPETIWSSGRGNFHLHSVSYNIVFCHCNGFIICWQVCPCNILTHVLCGISSFFFLSFFLRPGS